MNLEVDLARVDRVINSVTVRERFSKGPASDEDVSFVSQINFVVRALVEQAVYVPRVEYTRANVSTIVRYAYYARNAT
jgi:hypothetical protein